MLDIVILAAGKGTRMRSNTPKVMHKLAGRPFLSHVIGTASDLSSDSQCIVVVGHGAEVIESAYNASEGRGHYKEQELLFCEQKEQLGTGHAVQQALPSLRQDAIVLILYGDVPLIKRETLVNLVREVGDNAMALLTVELDDPTGYGRIIRDAASRVTSIVEQKDASEVQKHIREINSGIMAIKAKHLREWLPELKNENAQGEYYLTDVIALAHDKGIAINTVFASSAHEVAGVNNRLQQAELEREFQLMQARDCMARGLRILDPTRFDCRAEFHFGEDCEVDINCILEGDVRLGDGVKIGPNCMLKDISIGSGSEIFANSVLESCEIKERCSVGPFARIRPNTILHDGAKLGNFVEVKKSVIGKGSKVNHLSYIGDAELGEDVNVGAGTITCNYDGANKFKTEIGDRVFVGSNTALVAPVKLGSESTVGAGSVVTREVDSQQLAIARPKQRNVDGWKRPQKKS